MTRVNTTRNLHLKKDPKVHVCLHNHAQRQLRPPVPHVMDVVPAEADTHHVYILAPSPLLPTRVGISIVLGQPMLYEQSGEIFQLPNVPNGPALHLPVPPTPPDKPHQTPTILPIYSPKI